MLQEILEKNLRYIQAQKSYRLYDTELTSAVHILNTKNIMTLS